MKKTVSFVLCLMMTAALTACGGNDSSTASRTGDQSGTVRDVLKVAEADSEALETGAAGAETEAASPLKETETVSPVPETETVIAATKTEADRETLETGAASEEPKTEATSEEAEAMGEKAAAEAESVPAGADGVDVDLTVLSATMVYSEVYNMMVSPDDYVGKTVKMTGSFMFFRDEPTDTNYYSCIIRDATACCAQGIEFIPEGDFTFPDDFPQIGEDVTVVGEFATYKEGDFMYCTLRNATML